jgi:hypothetical protein
LLFYQSAKADCNSLDFLFSDYLMAFFFLGFLQTPIDNIFLSFKLIRIAKFFNCPNNTAHLFKTVKTEYNR